MHNKGEEGAKFRRNKVGIKWAGVTDKMPEMCHLEVWDERSGSERADVKKGQNIVRAGMTGSKPCCGANGQVGRNNRLSRGK